MAKAASLISTKAKSFVTGMNAVLKAKRDKKIEELTKKGTKDAAKTVYDVSLKVSKNSVTLSRTPEKQAESVASGRSWTCASAHMVDKARHVPMYYTKPGQTKKNYSKTAKEPWGNKDEHFMTFAEFSAAWSTQLGTQDIRNYKGKKAFDAGDAWHVELPSGKLLHSDPAVTTCMIHYAKLTRIDGGKANTKFEDSKWWKSDLAPHLKAAEDKADKERLDGLKAMRWSGAISGSQTMLSKANKNKTPIGKSFGQIDFLGPIDCGGVTTKPVKFERVLEWDSLAREVFEFLGLSPTKGFDVQLACTIVYKLHSYDNLSQTFISDLIPSCRLVYNTPVSKWLAMSVDVAADVKLKEASLVPEGSVTFNYDFKMPVDRDKGKIVLNIKGGKVTAK